MTDREPDLEIAATVGADELRFDCEPQVQVTAHADRPASVEVVSERENLPDDLEPGRSYRDLTVHWRASMRLKEADGAGE